LVIYLLYALFILSCIVIVIAVLLQPGKADAGALFTSSVSTTAFGPRGTQSLLAKITIAAAATFMLSALLITFGVGEPGSVMRNADGAAPAATPAATASPEAGTAPAEGAAAPAEGAAAPAASPEANTPAAPAASPAASPAAEASPAGR
jgi:preprotein translocase subunit SecG